MSKVISFSISDRYLDKLRTLYPNSTDNLAVKQFVTDRLDGSLDDALDDNLKTIIESSLSSTLDDVLDERLDGQLKTIIETSLDDVLDERLDAVMGKLISSLSERMARLEERLDGSLDDMELLLRMQREASITSLIPTGEPSHFPTIEENPDMGTVATVEIANTVESVDDTVEAVTDTVESVTDTVEAVDDTVEAVTDNVESDSIIESVEPAIGPVPGEGDSIEPGKGEGMNAVDADKYLKTKKVNVSDDSLYRWIRQEKIPDSHQGKKVQKYLTLINKLYYPKID